MRKARTESLGPSKNAKGLATLHGMRSGYKIWVQQSAQSDYMSARVDHSMKDSRESLINLGLRVRLPVRRIMTVVIVLACMLLGGCGGASTIWSATSQSPDGYWLAFAHTVQYTGPGANGVETTVEIKELKRNRFFRRSEAVLGFMNDGASMGLKMNWITPSHLEVVFRDDQKVLYHQVVRTMGVEISVRDLADPSSFPRNNFSY
jgi:hypothetical protein